LVAIDLRVAEFDVNVKIRIPGSQGGRNGVMPDNDAPAQKTDEEWREQLTPGQYAVPRSAGTEPPFSGEYTYNKESGDYTCAACGAMLFSADTKFDSGTGWPSFTAPAAAQALE